MFSADTYAFLADLASILHVSYIAAVILGQMAIIIGFVLRKPFAREVWFRSVHLFMMLVVAFQELFGRRCPLTDIENYFNLMAGREVDTDYTFLGRLATELTYYAFPDWVFTLIYLGFGAIVLSTMILYPPDVERFNEAHGYSKQP